MWSYNAITAFLDTGLCVLDAVRADAILENLKQERQTDKCESSGLRNHGENHGGVCSVLGALCSVLSAECWVLGAERWVLGVGCWVSGVGCWVLGAGCWVLLFCC